ncbi:MAG: 3'(2'),5'-bisphosphate nucleotidase CysQ [Bacteroidota bacterium]
MTYSDLLPQIIEIARTAGNEIMKIYTDESSDFGIEAKKDNSPLTKADKAANDLICQGLEALPIVYPIISEENKEVPYEVRRHYDMFWLVDPLDGTKEFIKRNGEFTVNIALVQGQSPVMGVVYAPALDECYFASKGGGAFVEKEGQQTPLQAGQFALDQKSLRVICSRSHLNDATQAFVDRLTEPELVSKGSSLKFLLLAGQQAELYPRLAPTMEWDTGAAQIVLEEAGGQVLNAEDHRPLRYNKPNLLNPYFIACGQMASQVEELFAYA